MILANLSTVLPDLANALSDFGSAPRNLLRTRAAAYISTALCMFLGVLLKISAQFHSILKQLLPVAANLLMRRSIVPWIVQTSRIRRRLIRQCQDRNHSSAYPNDYAFLVLRH